LLGDQPQLRDELSSWFAGLGEPALAAVALRPLLNEQTGEVACQTLVRIAVLLARAGDAVGAADALAGAAQESRSDPLPLELLGALGGWASADVGSTRAAEGYLDAAARRNAVGDRVAAFEDMLRAFEMAPELRSAAEQLAAELIGNGRSAAADEVLRTHAALLDEDGPRVHLRRMVASAAEGDLARAVGAAIDAGLPDDSAGAVGELVPPQTSVGTVLKRAGLLELAAARLEWHAPAGGSAETWAALGTLYAGPLRRPWLALRAYSRALAADPTSELAREALVEHALRSQDGLPLCGALLRVVLEHEDSEQRIRAAHELAQAAERAGDASLALFALEQVRALAGGQHGDDEARLAQRAEAESAELGRVLGLLGEPRADRRELAARAISLLSLRPPDPALVVALTHKLLELEPDMAHGASRLWLALEHIEQHDLLDTLLCHAASATGGSDFEQVVVHVALLRARRGDTRAALDALAGCLDPEQPMLLGCALSLMVALALGDDGACGTACFRLAAAQPSALRAVLGSVAGEAFLRAGRREEARQVLELAHRADPNGARPAAARAELALQEGAEGDAAALERAVGLVVPRAGLCRALALLHQLGEPRLAMAWTQRWLVLRPGDQQAAVELLERARNVRDADRLADALGWLLSQPQPLESLVEPIGEAIRDLGELDALKSVGVARRALNVLGSRSQELSAVLLRVAERAGDTHLAVAVIERWLAAGAPAAEQSTLLLDSARRHGASGDADSALRALHRALRAGARGEDVAIVLAGLGEPTSAEGRLALLEVRAGVLDAEGADSEVVCQAWRELAAARFDLADDRDGAFEAWQRVLVVDTERGAQRVADDLAVVCGATQALSALERLAESQPAKQSAALLAAAAALALEARQLPLAFSTAARALRCDATRADVLGIAEKSVSTENIDILEELYGAVADATLGCYGERAVHYRAARQLERRGRGELALAHAIRAFEAVPAQGVTLALMGRLARRSAHGDEAIMAVERIAAKADDARVRAAWLQRAALLCDDGEGSKSKRVDILLRAAAALPDASVLQAAARAAHELLRARPEQTIALQSAFERAVESLLPRLDGPQGARIAIEATRSAVEAFGAARLALRCLARAIESDGDVDEYAILVPLCAALAGERGAASKLLLDLVGQCDNPFARPGAALLGLARALAAELGDASAEATLRTAAGVGAPEVEQAVDPATELRESARKLEAEGAFADAAASWQRLLALEATDVEALEALERHATATSDFEMLADLLGRHWPLVWTVEDAHRLRLERAKVLEERLDRADEARVELEALLVEVSTNTDVLRRLAELYEHRGFPERAAPLWQQACLAADVSEERIDLATRAARAFLDARDTMALRSWLAELGPLVDEPPLCVMRVALARSEGDRRELARALERLAEVSEVPAQDRAQMLEEAADCYLAAGDLPASLRVAEAACALRPAAKAVLMASYVRYLVHGPGEAEDAAKSAEWLASLRGLDAAESELRVFLQAEALDRSGAAGAAEALLQAAQNELPGSALVALGLAERLAVGPQAVQALPLFASALRGDLRRLRSSAEVALRAAKLAAKYADIDRARECLDLVLREEPTHQEAQDLKAALLAGLRAQPVPSVGPVSDEALLEVPSAPEITGRAMGTPSSPPSSASPGRYSLRPPAESDGPLTGGAALMARAPSVPPSVAPPSSGRAREETQSPWDARLDRSVVEATSDVERGLVERLAAGSAEAGQELLTMLERHADRSADRVEIARRVAELEPGALRTLERLLSAARADRDHAYSSSVEHALRVGSASEQGLEPPVLDEVAEQSELVRGMLYRGSVTAGAQALALVLDSAEHVFRREPVAYGITGLERVQLGAPTILGRVYSAAARALGLSRTPLYHRRVGGAVAVSVALLSPPSLVVTGDIDTDSPELWFHMGAMLTAATPEYALLFGSPESEVRAVLTALLFAFGPTDHPKQGHFAAVANLAEVLWESVPARSQRKLRELCQHTAELDYDTVLLGARQALRRAGLFVCGDLGVALRETCFEEGISADPLARLDGLHELCQTNWAARDLVVLATSPVYAETRWKVRRRGHRFPSGGRQPS
jgi:hypothetical protein